MGKENIDLRAVAVCGHICSGKSSIVNYLSELYNWDVISFGKYVRHLADTKGLPSTRETYQILGQQLINELGAQQFLYNTIQFNQPISTIHLYDGVRHMSVLAELRLAYRSTLVIYLDVSDSVRYARFKTRAADGDPSMFYDEFLQLSKRPVEQENSRISRVADLHIDASSSFSAITTEIKAMLLKNQFVEP